VRENRSEVMKTGSIYAVLATSMLLFAPRASARGRFNCK